MNLTAPQRLLMDALLLPSPLAEGAWRRWLASIDLDCPDSDSFHLLPALAGRMPAWLANEPRRTILLGICRRAWSRNQVQRKLLSDAVQILVAAGIERVAAMGPIVWGPLYWPAGAIRPIGRVDLLIEPALVRPAFDALSRAGWKVPNAIPETRGRQLAFAGGTLLQSPSRGQVYVHWRVLPNTNLSLQYPEFPPLETLRPGLVAPHAIPPEHSLVVALAGTHEDGIAWHFDALMICRQPGLRWEKVEALLKHRSVPRARLDELRREYGIEIPQKVTRSVWTNRVAQILASTLRSLRCRRVEPTFPIRDPSAFQPRNSQPKVRP